MDAFVTMLECARRRDSLSADLASSETPRFELEDARKEYHDLWRLKTLTYASVN
jgi:hypothetical protein